jgi:hypothetical protein
MDQTPAVERLSSGFHASSGIALRLPVPAGIDFQGLVVRRRFVRCNAGISTAGCAPVDVVTAPCRLGEGGEPWTAYHGAAAQSQVSRGKVGIADRWKMMDRLRP